MVAVGAAAPPVPKASDFPRDVPGHMDFCDASKVDFISLPSSFFQLRPFCLLSGAERLEILCKFAAMYQSFGGHDRNLARLSA